MIKCVAIALIVMLAAAQTAQEWDDWKQKYHRNYATAQEQTVRHGYWVDAYKLVQLTNSAQSGYVAALNEMSDYSPDELQQLRGSHYDSGQEPGTSYAAVNGEPKTAAALPTSVDWRTVNAVTSIKNQANCGCCWSFSATAYIESFTIIKFNKTYDLSEEYILECTPLSDCGGGYVSKAMNLSLTGMPNDTSYPYLASNWGLTGRPNNGICSTTNKNIIPTSTVTIYNNVTDTQLKTMLTNSPIPALINADAGFQAYSSGTYSCAGTATMTTADLNHAIQLIGYDSSGNYLIKNSWGTTWGVNGYATVSSTLDCGIKLVVYEFTSAVPSVITLNSTTTNNTNSTNSTTNSTTNTVKKFEWKMAFMLVLALISVLVTA